MWYTMGCGAKPPLPPRIWVVFENFCVKSMLTLCKVTFNCKLQKQLNNSRAIAGTTARCRCKFRYISKFTAASHGFSATA